MIFIFDGMRLKSNFEYSRMTDDIIGHEDIGPEEKTTKKADNLELFMIKSLFGNWSEIIGHHFTASSFSKERLKKAIHQKLAALHSANLICAEIVCDQEPSHASLFLEWECQDPPRISDVLTLIGGSSLCTTLHIC